MIISTGSYLVNDTMMKLATSGRCAYEVRGARGTVGESRCCSRWATASR